MIQIKIELEGDNSMYADANKEALTIVGNALLELAGVPRVVITPTPEPSNTRFTDIFTKLDAQDRRVCELADRVEMREVTVLDETERKLEEACKHVNLLQRQKTTTDAKLNGQRDRADTMQKQLRALYNKVTVLDENADQQARALVQFESIAVKTAEKVEKLGLKLAALENQLDLSEKQRISQSKAFVELYDRVDICSERLTLQSGRADDFFKRMGEQIGRLDGHAMNILEIKNKVSKLEQAVWPAQAAYPKTKRSDNL